MIVAGRDLVPGALSLWPTNAGDTSKVRPTLHLAPLETWAAATAIASSADDYAPASLGDEGFVHCTDGDVELLRTAERHYRGDPRPYVALTVDLDLLGVPWTLDDPGRIYPHIHGPIPRRAIMAVRHVTRSADGAFIGLGPPVRDAAAEIGQR